MLTKNFSPLPSLIDILFDGRNKEYGAYELRTNYSKRIRKSIAITLTIAALICGGTILASSVRKNKPRVHIGPPIEISEVPMTKTEPIPEPEKPRETKTVKTVAYTPPVITPDIDVQNTPPTQDEISTAAIGTETYDGPVDDGVPTVNDIDQHRGIVDPPVQSKEPEIFTSVEIEAKYPGNWAAFLENTLRPDVATENNAPAGHYSVVLEFVVDKEGMVSNIKALTQHGYGMEEEAIRALKKAKQWEPAFQNGIKVKSYKRQVIVFVVEI